MRFLKAFEIANKPYIQWHGWANNEKELEELGEENNPLIVAENNIPAYQYGVCPWKIEGGLLVERTSIEMEAFEAEFIAIGKANVYKNKALTVDTATFDYDGQDFPMHATARLYYSVIEHTAANYTVMAMGGNYELASADCSDFIAEYYKQLRQLTQPEI